MAIAILGALVGMLIYFVAPRRDVEGITIQATLFEQQTMPQNFNYRHLVKGVLQGDGTMLAPLVKSPCGGGAGCYEHGEVLAHILRRVGEREFTKMLQTLKPEDQIQLGSLLAAGFEYGNFAVNQGHPNLALDYPELARRFGQAEKLK